MAQNRQASYFSLTGIHPYPWIHWWYALAAPPVSDNLEELPLKEREFLRRGKLTSIALFVQTVQLLIQLASTLQGTQKTAVVLVLINLGFVVISILLNRSRKLLPAGLLLISFMEVGLIFVVATPMGGYMSVAQLAYFNLLIQPLMISVLIFPAWGILVMGAINALVVIMVLFFLPRTAELQVLIHTEFIPIISLPVTTIIICALVCFIVITSLQENLVRADKAEEVNKLHQMMGEQIRRELQMKSQLEAGVNEIVTAMTSFANGNQQSRIRLEQGHVLWSVASSINNMIGRSGRLRAQGRSTEQTFMALNSYITMVRAAKLRGRPLPVPETGTEIDTLVAELLSYSSSESLSQPNVSYSQSLEQASDSTLRSQM